MNPWHDIKKDRILPEDFLVFVEITKGSQTKYELDKETGLLILDRVLYTSTHYPMNYGFIPLTYCEDQDPLDAFVLCSQPIKSGTLVRCYPIGVVHMKDRGEEDTKIIAVPFGDPVYNNFTDIKELPKHVADELMHFLNVYKQLENKEVKAKNMGGAAEAKLCIDEGMQSYENIIKKKR